MDGPNFVRAYFWSRTVQSMFPREKADQRVKDQSSHQRLTVQYLRTSTEPPATITEHSPNVRATALCHNNTLTLPTYLPTYLRIYLSTYVHTY